MILRDLAHARAGDKGDTSNLVVIVHRAEDYAGLEKHLTPECVRAWLDVIVQGEVERFDLPGLGAFNFVLKQSLGGGVTRSAALDSHGKALSGRLLALPLPETLTLERGV